MQGLIFMSLVAYLILVSIRTVYIKSIIDNEIEIKYLIFYYISIIIITPIPIIGLSIIMFFIGYIFKDVFNKFTYKIKKRCKDVR